MINRLCMDQSEDAIECFEANWTSNSRDEIGAILDAFELRDDDSTLIELIRVDIELRYRNDLPVTLNEYFETFEGLLEDADSVSQIAFEDYRSRWARGLEVPASRWADLPGIADAIWYQDLRRERPTDSTTAARPLVAEVAERSDTDAAFASALQEAGFRLIHEIGGGALSRVFLANQHELADRYVVLKVVDRPLAEPQSMAMLQHTNIVPIYSFHRILSRSVICMPYAGSVTLAEFLHEKVDCEARGGESLVMTVRNRVRDTTVTETQHQHEHRVASTRDGEQEERPTQPAAAGCDDTECCTSIPAADENAVLKPLERIRSMGCNELATWIFARLAAALAHSHARGVLHGDLKPGNVLIRNDGEPALLDFNLSRSLVRKAVHHIGGTLPYMAPESYRALMGQRVEPQCATDIYGLGVMLFEFVTGRLPFPEPRSIAPIDLQPAIDARQHEPDWQPHDAVSPGLRAIIQQCLSYSPEDRYAGAEDLQQDLECEQQNRPLLNVGEPSSERLKKWIRRHPQLISGGSVGLALLMLLIPIGFWANAWRGQSLRLSAETRYDEFARESARVLAAIMVDPRRHEGAGVEPAMIPLQEFGILDGSGMNAFRSSHTTDRQLAIQRNTFLRHIVQVAWTESDRLRADRMQAPLSADQLLRFDQLLTAAARISADKPSRACAFLQAKRAQLAGDIPAFERLQSKAARIAIDSDSESYLEAVRLMTERKWSVALEKLTVLADRNSIPSSLRWTMMGRAQYNSRQYEEAKLSITQSLEYAPQASRLWFMRGLCYQRLKQAARAESDFSKTLDLEPTFVPAWTSRAVSRLSQRKMKEGIADLTKGLQLSPGHAQILINRSEAYYALGMTSKAEHDIEEAIKSENVSSASVYSRGRKLMDLDPEQALADFHLAFKLDPERVSALTLGARTLSTRLNRTDEAIELLTKAIELKPEYETARADRSVLYAQLGRKEAALRDLSVALKPPNYDRTLYQATCTNALLNRPRRAITLLAQAIQAGYKADRLATDPDLESIRDTADFRAISRAYLLSNRDRLQQTSSKQR